MKQNNELVRHLLYVLMPKGISSTAFFYAINLYTSLIESGVSIELSLLCCHYVSSNLDDYDKNQSTDDLLVSIADNRYMSSSNTTGWLDLLSGVYVSLNDVKPRTITTIRIDKT